MPELPRIACLGLNYLSAPVEVRERLAGAVPEIEAAAARLRQRGILRGFVVLSTCNRIECYAQFADGADGAPRTVLLDLVSCAVGATPESLLRHTCFTEGADTFRHLFRVASGLDSMVLGEPQILGQVGEALRESEANGLCSTPLASLFQAAIKAGKRARAETGLSRNPVSIASVAVDMADREAGSLSKRHVTLVGAGDTASLVAKLLKARDVQAATIINRTEERGASLAGRCQFESYGVSALSKVLSQTDVVICATRAPHTVVEPEHLEGCAKPLVLLDLAVPRDVNPAVAELPGVRLFDIDRMRDAVDTSLEMRRREIPAAEAIIEEELAQFRLGLKRRAVEPVIAGLRRKAEAIRKEELTRTFGEMETLSAEARERLQYFSRSLVNKLLHDPTRRLRERAVTDEAESDSALVRSLFSL